jgi:hypothetical protein
MGQVELLDLSHHIIGYQRHLRENFTLVYDFLLCLLIIYDSCFLPLPKVLLNPPRCVFSIIILFFLC